MYRVVLLRNFTSFNSKILSMQKCFLKSYSHPPNLLPTCPKIKCYGVHNAPGFNSNQQLFSQKTNEFHQFHLKRFQTTTSTPASAPKKRKPKRLQAKYVELLQVTSLSTKHIRTKVKNLKPNKLAELILRTQAGGSFHSGKQTSKKTSNSKKTSTKKEKYKYQPDEYKKIDLEMFEENLLYDSAMNSKYANAFMNEKPLIFFKNDKSTIINDPDKVREILHSLNNYKEEMMITSTELSSMNHRDPDEYQLPEENEIDLHEEVALKKVEEIPKSAIKEKQERFKSKYYLNPEQMQLSRQRAILTNLKSYLNICVTTGMLNRATSTLLYCRLRFKKNAKMKSSEEINLFNIILSAYADKGNFPKVKEILEIIQQDKIPLNEQSFAAIFLSLGRSQINVETRDLIFTYSEKAHKMGISFNSIMDKSKFICDQREVVLDTIRIVSPEFQPVYTPPKLTYSNELLNSLNKYTLSFNNEENGEREISTDSKIMDSKRGFTKEELHSFAKEQLKIELEGDVTVKSIEKTKEYTNPDLYRKKIDELQQLWKSQICAAINRDLSSLRSQTQSSYVNSPCYYAYIKSLTVNDYANILLKEIRTIAEGSETFSPTVNQLYRNLGKKVYTRYQIDQKKRTGVLDKIGEIYSSYCEKLEDCNSSDNPRQMWQRIMHESRSSGPSVDIEENPWPASVLLGVGRFLYNILMRDIKIDSNIMRSHSKIKTQNLLPAFYTIFRNHGKTVKEEIKPHPVLSRLIRASKQKTLTFDSNLVPMICPPIPWHTTENGGFLLTKSELIRLPQQAIQQCERINETTQDAIYPALDSLNQLASVPWKVNSDILEVILEVFNNGGDMKLDVPLPPSSLQFTPSITGSNSELSSAQRSKLFKEKLVHRRRQSEMYSLWCDTLYRLSLANHYRDKVFWLPHNMDFRGRVYAIPPHLSHLGSDLARSMLVFAQPKPLGIDGFSWLKLHCINLTGIKKRDSIKERLLYAEEVMDDILDSADNPLTGRKWWTKSDEPWQTLACCIEIAKVHKCPEPEKYLSHFPIHQDGSCNGLQHYAALGRDKSGAISVNLAPSKIPQDVYSAVAALIEKSRIEDAKNGLQVAQILQNFVKRKVIKQTVMTTVYGVTRYGARLQIARQLKDIDEFPKEWVWPASNYLTAKTFESLREMFTSTKEIQDWFTECARLISAVCGRNVEWVTPLGLPVVQPYNRFIHKILNSKNNIKVSENISMDLYEKPNVMKQKNAFPPNFIHSLDSSHMMLTSLYSERKGITFISVHDCFWTHACTVPDMNKICREQFVALHSQPILENLSKYLVEKYSFSESEFENDGSVIDTTKRKLNRVLRNLPEKGDFDLNEVLKSVYFFS